MNLYRDATGVIVGTQVEAKRMGKGWVPIEVPTDKQGLIDYLNALPHRQSQPEMAVPAWSDDDLPTDHFVTKAPSTIIMDPGPTATKAPLHRDRVCEAISTYDGADLGYVALEVACRFKALA